MSNSNLNLLPETMFFDIFSQPGYPMSHYKNSENDEINMLNNNNNITKSEVSMNTIEVINPNVTHLVNFPLNMMPPPPHKMVNYNNNNNTVKRYQPRETTRPRDNYRPISPKGYDSDESCASHSSRETPPDNRIKYYNNARSGVNRLSDQTVVFGKYSQSSPNVYHSNVQCPSHIQHGPHNNGHYNKNRYSYMLCVVRFH
ncbi:hypothetical protein JTB14_025448 [Gonioctena quinquepunctata]|nr:hypothetical protein JTB14_025448 [Gonioctena quinquepunctata]